MSWTADPETLTALGLLAGAVVFGVLVSFLVHVLLVRFAGRTATPIDDAVRRHGRWPLRVLFPVLLVFLVLPALRPDLPEVLVRWLDLGLRLAVPALFGWALVAAVRVAEDYTLSRLDLSAADNLHARKLYTQVGVLKRIAIVLIVLLTVAVILMSYDRLAQIGKGLLASAGLAGVILGFAAQRSLGNLLAGIQIATTQPIRIDDVVVVEGEWGRIEEITLTYVVVRIWDLRRLVLPISYFIENPFENWTRTSAALLGTVYVYVDYTVPVAEVRAELLRILEASDAWDGGTWGLQVTDAKERTLELRALMSAPDSGTAWDLRCLVREKLVAWLQESYPDALPRVRLERRDGIEAASPGSRDGASRRVPEDDRAAAPRGNPPSGGPQGHATEQDAESQ